MPFLTITATPGLTEDQKQQLLLRSSNTVVKTLGSSLASVRITLHELPKGHYLSAGQFDIPNVTYEIDLIAGRTEEQKAALIAALGKTAHEATGVALEEVRARITDFPNTNMGMANGITAKQAGR